MRDGTGSGEPASFDKPVWIGDTPWGRYSPTAASWPWDALMRSVFIRRSKLMVSVPPSGVTGAGSIDQLKSKLFSHDICFFFREPVIFADLFS